MSPWRTHTSPSASPHRPGLTFRNLDVVREDSS
jgi:hypothetical protein